MSVAERIRQVDDRKWQAFTSMVQIVFILAIVVFCVVAFQTQAQVKEFKQQVSEGNCSGIVFENMSPNNPTTVDPDDLVIQNEKAGNRSGG